MITIDDATVMAELGAMMERLANPKPYLEEVGLWQMEQARERILSTKEDPDGNPWIRIQGDISPWGGKRTWQRDVLGNADLGLLNSTGELLNSIHFAVDGNVVDIGSNSPHAQMQYQTLWDGSWERGGPDGTETTVPAREFLGWSPQDIADLELSALLYVMGE